MAGDERSLQGWAPVPGADADLDQIVDLAFDYRGDVTLVRADGTTLEGYVFNRNARAMPPFLELFDPDGGRHTLRYTDILTILFTGKDTAAGKSYDAWLRRKAEAGAPPDA
jgi:hypothetical protein